MSSWIKLPLIVVALSISIHGQSQNREELRVLSGTTLIVESAFASISVSKWIMEDDSTLLISSRICEGRAPCMWTINAEEASFGSNTRIIGYGEDGPPGKDGALVGDGDRCNPGPQGHPGDTGDSGKDGISVSISMGIKTMGSLLIDVHGGEGGRGGAGSRGGNGGRGSCSLNCKGGAGGRGGNGERGGNGGNGGDIHVSLWLAGDEPIAIGHDAIWGISSGGKAGTGGAYGPGGGGGGSKRKMRSLAGLLEARRWSRRSTWIRRTIGKRRSKRRVSFRIFTQALNADPCRRAARSRSQPAPA